MSYHAPADASYFVMHSYPSSASKLWSFEGYEPSAFVIPNVWQNPKCGAVTSKFPDRQIVQWEIRHNWNDTNEDDMQQRASKNYNVGESQSRCQAMFHIL